MHLDRKLERMLAMLYRLKDLRQQPRARILIRFAKRESSLETRARLQFHAEPGVAHQFLRQPR